MTPSDTALIETSTCHAALVRPDTERCPEFSGRWECRMQVQRGGAAGSNVNFCASFSAHAALIEGTGLAADFPKGKGAAPCPVSITGVRDGDECCFEVWFDHELTRGAAFHLIGRIASDRKTIEGDFNVACFFPGDCDCGGQTGSFTLRRVG